MDSGKMVTRSGEGRPITFHFSSLRITASIRNASTEYQQEWELLKHEVSPLLFDWLVDIAPGVAVSTLSNHINAGNHFLNFLHQTERWRVNAETIGHFLEWLMKVETRRGGTFLESSSRRIIGCIDSFAEWLSQETDVLNLSERESIRRRYSVHFKGFTEREQRRLEEISSGIAPEDLGRLYKAVRLNLERLEELVFLTESDGRVMHPATPLVPFVQLLGLQLGVRSGELNNLKQRDIDRRAGLIYVHQANKRPASLPISPEIERALALATTWQAVFRTDADCGEAPALMYPVPCRRSESCLRQLDSSRFSYHLKAFYRWAFDEIDPAGNRLLFSQEPGRNIEPFSLPFHLYRHAAITEYARVEPDVSKLRIFARHEWFRTTERYIRLPAEEVDTATLEAIGPLSERVRMRVYASRATPEELVEARETGALLPGGVCGEALQGQTECRRAVDCRVCEQFLIDPRKRAWFEEDTTRRRRRIAQLEDAGPYIRDVQNELSIIALNEAVLEAIDEWDLQDGNDIP